MTRRHWIDLAIAIVLLAFVALAVAFHSYLAGGASAAAVFAAMKLRPAEQVVVETTDFARQEILRRLTALVPPGLTPHTYPVRRSASTGRTVYQFVRANSPKEAIMSAVTTPSATLNISGLASDVESLVASIVQEGWATVVVPKLPTWLQPILVTLEPEAATIAQTLLAQYVNQAVASKPIAALQAIAAAHPGATNEVNALINALPKTV